MQMIGIGQKMSILDCPALMQNALIHTAMTGLTAKSSSAGAVLRKVCMQLHGHREAYAMTRSQ